MPRIDTAVENSPKLSRGIVWCHTCGREQKVDSRKCLPDGWPMCCEATMSLDSPEERKSLTPHATDAAK